MEEVIQREKDLVYRLAFSQCHQKDEQAYIFEKKEIDLTPYLNKLPKKYNAVLYLFYYEGYSTKEMAKLLHIKENNVRVLLNRARNKLRKEIESDEK